MISIACQTQNKLHKYACDSEQLSGLKSELVANRNYIESVRDSLALLVESKDDKVTPKRFLVTEGRAKLIKSQAEDVVQKYSDCKGRLGALNIIINGCEDHGIEWDEYCFGNMPYNGVEPILLVYISQYEKALEEIEQIK